MRGIFRNSKGLKLFVARLLLVAIVTYLCFSGIFLAHFRLDGDHRIAFTTLDEVALEKVARISEPAERYVFHVTKECSPLVNFGGVAQVVGELAEGFASQLGGTRVFVLLPHYGFISNTRLIAQFEYRLPKRTVRVSISALELDNIVFFFVGAPSHLQELWSSTKVEDIYNIKHRYFGLKTITRAERDLHFSFVAAHAIHLISSLNTSLKQGVFVHVHGATNAPTAWFLRNSYIQKTLSVRVLYTMHDYNSEPTIKYKGKTLDDFMHAQGRNTRAFVGVRDDPKILKELCSSASTQANVDFGSRGYVDFTSAHMISCFDAVTTVSEGMISELMHGGNHDMSASILKLQSLHRLRGITNWVSSTTWHNAREFVSGENPAKEKSVAKEKFVSVFNALKSESKQSAATSCSVLWLGRFEINKGIEYLPDIYATACEFGCYSIVAGYSTSSKQNKLLKNALKRTALHKHCPIFIIKDKKQQDMYGHLIRSAADVVVVPSSAEAYGLVAAEALAYGSIPVVSKVGGLQEVVRPYPESNWTGFTFEYFPLDRELTSLSLKLKLAEALSAYQAACEEQSLNSLQRRIIHSTPRVGNGGGKVEIGAGSLLNYIALMKELMSTNLKSNNE